MVAERFIYFSKRMLRYLAESPSGTSATFITLTLFLFMAGLSHTAHGIALKLLPAWVEHNKAVVYIDPSTSRQELDRLAAEIEKWQNIQKVRVKSAQDAKKELEQRLGEWKDIPDLVPEGGLPSSLEVDLSHKLRSQDEIVPILEKIRQYPQVEAVFAGNGLSEKLESLLGPIRFWGAGATGILGILALLMVYYSTMVIFQTRREEMEIYSILGATPLFIRAPLYMECVFSGLIGGVAASVCLAFVVSRLKQILPIPMAAALPHGGAYFLILGVSLSGCGMVVSLLGRWLAFRRAFRIARSKYGPMEEHAQNP